MQTDAAGNSYGPWRLDIRDTRITWMGSLPHSRHSQVDAWNEGRHDGWLEAKRSGTQEYSHLPLTMGHYTREDLPFYYALADAFTVCDQNYCSVMTSTTPNRSYFLDRDYPRPAAYRLKSLYPNEQIDYGGMSWKTFPERLQEAGISWKCYQNELTRSGLSGEKDAWLGNSADNVLEFFSAYNVEAYPGYALAAHDSLRSFPSTRRSWKPRYSEQTDAAIATKLRAALGDTRSQIETIRHPLPKAERPDTSNSPPGKSAASCGICHERRRSRLSRSSPLSFEDRQVADHAGPKGRHSSISSARM